jgi:hypothetical protein
MQTGPAVRAAGAPITTPVRNFNAAPREARVPENREKTMSVRSKAAQAVTVAAGTLLLAASAAGSASATSIQENPTFKTMREACGDGYLCVFSGPAGTGEMFKYYECTADPVNAPWQIKSWINNQYTGTVAGFWGPDPADPEGPWIQQYTSTAPEFDDDARGFDTRAVDPC